MGNKAFASCLASGWKGSYETSEIGPSLRRISSSERAFEGGDAAIFLELMTIRGSMKRDFIAVQSITNKFICKST